MIISRKMKPAALFLAATLFLFSAAVHSPFLHSYLHGHAHGTAEQDLTHSDHAKPVSHEPHSSKPCETCNSCRAQNHFAFHLAALLHFCPEIQPAVTDVPGNFQTRPVFYLNGTLYGRAPPAFSF